MARVPQTARRRDDDPEVEEYPQVDLEETHVPRSQEIVEYGGGVASPGSMPVINPATCSAEPDVVADATARNPRPAGPVPTARRFTVIRGGSVSQPGPGGTGYRTVVREGKVVDNLNYDIEKLLAQGIKLEELKD